MRKSGPCQNHKHKACNSLIVICVKCAHAPENVQVYAPIAPYEKEENLCEKKTGMKNNLRHPCGSCRDAESDKLAYGVTAPYKFQILNKPKFCGITEIYTHTYIENRTLCLRFA